MRVDLHAHFIPPDYRTMAEERGLTAGGGYFPAWTPELHLQFMHDYEITTTVLSISDPGPYVGNNLDDAIRIAREINEYAAELRKQFPDRFRALAALPIHDLDASFKELEYALDTLGLDGVGLLSSFADEYVGDARHERLYAELNDRHAYVFVHPGTPAALPNLKIAPWVIEFPLESTRVAANLIYGGVLDRYPHIKFQLSHTGGALPYLAQRIAWLTSSPADELSELHVPNDVHEQYRRLFYDTAMTSNTLQLDLTESIAGPSQIVFGSDYPFSQLPPPPDPSRSLTQIDPERRRQIDAVNPLSLLPDLDNET